MAIRGCVVCQGVREYYLGKLTTASAACVFVCGEKARVNPEYPSHFGVPFHKEGAAEAGGSV